MLRGLRAPAAGATTGVIARRPKNSNARSARMALPFGQVLHPQRSRPSCASSAAHAKAALFFEWSAPGCFHYLHSKSQRECGSCVR